MLPEVVSEPRLPTWSLEKVNAPKTWGEYGYTGKGVVVGVMDSGVDGGHPALASRWRGRNGDSERELVRGDGRELRGAGRRARARHARHGSIVGGAPGEIVGVAPDAEWIAVKIFRDTGSTSSSIIHDGFQWMLAPGGDPAKAPRRRQQLVGLGGDAEHGVPRGRARVGRGRDLPGIRERERRPRHRHGRLTGELPGVVRRRRDRHQRPDRLLLEPRDRSSGTASAT